MGGVLRPPGLPAYRDEFDREYMAHPTPEPATPESVKLELAKLEAAAKIRMARDEVAKWREVTVREACRLLEFKRLPRAVREVCSPARTLAIDARLNWREVLIELCHESDWNRGSKSHGPYVAFIEHRVDNWQQMDGEALLIHLCPAGELRPFDAAALAFKVEYDALLERRKKEAAAVAAWDASVKRRRAEQEVLEKARQEEAARLKAIADDEAELEELVADADREADPRYGTF